MQENKMGYLPIPKLLFNMSGPIALSMLFQSLYNVVDSIFVSRIGEEALAAVSMAFPIQSLMNAVAIGTGVGMNALLSRSLGQRKFEKANLIGQIGFILTVASTFLFILIGLLFSDAFFATQTNNPLIHEYGVQYTHIITLFSVGIFAQIGCERLLQSTGRSFESMLTQIAGALINIIFDPILIFGLGPFPELGVAGAAYATVGGQITAALMGIFLNLKRNKEINLFQKGFHFNANIVKNVYGIGFPTMVMIAAGSLTIFIINTILGWFSSTAVVAYGIYFKLQSFVLLPVFGMNNGMVPIIAYNYGSGHKERIYEVIKVALTAAFVFMVAGFLLFQFAPDVLLGFFEPSQELLELGRKCLRICSISFLLAFFPIVVASVLQALGNGVASMIISLIRQLIVLCPAAYLLSRTGNVNNVWFALPIAEFTAITISFFALRKILRTHVDHLVPIEEREKVEQ
ncbi:MATE family efflux transporter [Peptoniphilus sp. KCTC 25270]|uniref:MATE family efflux transporter n=1 Tax=Peptoniphilus sp. KCTC 25270 TaxID=2897414 RepID=UPI001E56C0C7|nr:MATE family efflux transporter [Peptoniphilus sp. KCTC 25270]MCD1147853.1 MATE family efflux transporter [Peptoniphilus sp. KCTC 25270]